MFKEYYFNYSVFVTPHLLINHISYLFSLHIYYRTLFSKVVNQVDAHKVIYFFPHFLAKFGLSFWIMTITKSMLPYINTKLHILQLQFIILMLSNFSRHFRIFFDFLVFRQINFQCFKMSNVYFFFIHQSLTRYILNFCFFPIFFFVREQLCTHSKSSVFHSF